MTAAVECLCLVFAHIFEKQRKSCDHARLRYLNFRVIWCVLSGLYSSIGKTKFASPITDSSTWTDLVQNNFHDWNHPTTQSHNERKAKGDQVPTLLLVIEHRCFRYQVLESSSSSDLASVLSAHKFQNEKSKRHKHNHNVQSTTHQSRIRPTKRTSP